jgi:hypothetical protein
LSFILSEILLNRANKTSPDTIINTINAAEVNWLLRIKYNAVPRTILIKIYRVNDPIMPHAPSFLYFSWGKASLKLASYGNATCLFIPPIP